MNCSPDVRSDSPPRTSANIALIDDSDRYRDEQLVGTGNEAQKRLGIAEMEIEYADRIGSDTKICGVTETDEAAVTEDKIKAGRGDCVDDDPCGERN